MNHPLPQSASKPRGRRLFYFLSFLAILTTATSGAWIYRKNQQAKAAQHSAHMAFLDHQGRNFVEDRRWQEASEAFAKIEVISPHSDLALRGRRSIETGMVEEQTQFIGYWTGRATAELEAGRLDESATAARQVLDKYPGEKDAAAILEKISKARVGQSRSAAIASARTAMDQRKWDSAISTLKLILAKSPTDTEAKSILTNALAGQEKAANNQKKALALLAQASARDTGQFDQQALDWLREANSLAPDHKEISARLEKLSAYTRTLRVPEDFPSPDKALAAAHAHDRIILGPGTWKGPIFVNSEVEIQGAGSADTTIECVATDGSAITIGPGAKNARVSGVSFRHQSFATGTDRFSVALVRGGSVMFVDCRFTEASGHGLAVIGGGQAHASRSRFTGNGWDGVAAIGKGSRIEIRDCEALDNFDNGIESWDGAAVVLLNNRCEGNSRNGIHADSGLATAIIEGNQLLSNRELGLVLTSAASGKISGNTARANLLGGFVIRATASQLPVTRNHATLNLGPGIILERGLSTALYTTNTATQNQGQQMVANLNLSSDILPAGELPKATDFPPKIVPRTTAE